MNVYAGPSWDRARLRSKAGRQHAETRISGLKQGGNRTRRLAAGPPERRFCRKSGAPCAVLSAIGRSRQPDVSSFSKTPVSRFFLTRFQSKYCPFIAT